MAQPKPGYRFAHPGHSLLLYTLSPIVLVVVAMVISVLASKFSAII